MADLKTEIVVVNGANKVHFSEQQPSLRLTKEQTASIKLEAPIAQTKTIKQHLQELKENAADTRKISKINPFASYFPSFYKKELRNAFTSFVI
jgi:hypothetical protein